ncbi:MAG: hypothetical protein ACLGIF_05165 [Actinomycetes bacterium]
MRSSRFARELRDATRPRSVADLAAEGVTRSMLRGPAWRRTTYGYYAPALAAAASTAQRILDATPLVPGTGALTGWAALFVHGCDVFDGTDGRTGRPEPLPILLGRDVGRRSVPGILLRRDQLSERERTWAYGLPLTTPLRATFDAVRDAPSCTEAVVRLDAAGPALRADLDQLRIYCVQHSGWRGIRQVEAALALADLGVRSTWETRLRIFYQVDLGLPRPLVNPPVFGLDGSFLGMVDLLDPEAGLALEFDGQDHRQRGQHRRDNLREEGLEQANLTVARVDSLDLQHHRPELARRLRSRRAQGMRRDRTQDRWTLTEPDWWRLRHAS